MGKIAVVTDSSANLPEDLIQQWGIHVVPAVLAFRGETFRDGQDVTPGELYRWLRADRYLPTTSAPSIGDFVRVYASLGTQIDGIVSIHPPPQLTSTYNVALAASELVDDVPIRVVTSNGVAMSQGFVVLEAARTATAGAGLAAVLARTADVARRVQLLAAIDTLEYLRRGGRVGAAAAILGAALQIKPILYVTDGDVQVFAKPRTKAKAMRLILEHMTARAGDHRLHAAVVHADVPDEAEDVRRQIASRFDCVELYVTEFTPVMGAHTGPGLLGVAFYAEDGLESQAPEPSEH